MMLNLSILFLSLIFLFLDCYGNSIDKRISSLEERMLRLEKMFDSINIPISNNLSKKDNTIAKIDKLDNEIDNEDDIIFDTEIRNKSNLAELQDKKNISTDKELKNLYDKAIQRIEIHKYEDARNILEKIVSKKDENENKTILQIKASSYYLLGQIAFQAQDYNLASKKFLSSYNKYILFDRNNLGAMNSLLYLAKNLKQMNKNEGACNILKKIQYEFPSLPSELEKEIKTENKICY